jgi:hypothetical protein
MILMMRQELLDLLLQIRCELLAHASDYHHVTSNELLERLDEAIIQGQRPPWRGPDSIPK